MLNIDFTFLWTAVNLVILYLFLKKYLFGRVGDYMDERAKTIEEDMKKGRDMVTQGEDFREKQRLELETAAEKRAEILDEARKKASGEYDKIVADAKKESERILADSRVEIERQRADMMDELRDDVATLALAAATKVIEANMDDEKNRKLVQEFLDKEGVA